ncbi:hypothetical protein PsYK624_085350 [Phanerochaete sordida]|uniref:Uncharacterized protein n=1 Tax=Phanerochaete sordida TaxID=48140 RepID=A0A9P3LEC5_9APHY|nr:hypothetical protein PsYK624_085350 [Phanerochaete sordida]
MHSEQHWPNAGSPPHHSSRRASHLRQRAPALNCSATDHPVPHLHVRHGSALVRRPSVCARMRDADEGASTERAEPPQHAFEDHELSDADAEGEPDDGEPYCTDDEDAEGEDDDGEYEVVGCMDCI